MCKYVKIFFWRVLKNYEKYWIRERCIWFNYTSSFNFATISRIFSFTFARCIIMIKVDARNNADDTNSAHKLKNCSCLDDGVAERYEFILVFVGIENARAGDEKNLLSLECITTRDFLPHFRNLSQKCSILSRLEKVFSSRGNPIKKFSFW